MTQHNFASFTSRSNEDIMKENDEKYKPDVRASWEQKWYDKLSPKKRRAVFYILGFTVGFLSGSLICSIIWWLFL